MSEATEITKTAKPKRKLWIKTVRDDGTENRADLVAWKLHILDVMQQRMNKRMSRFAESVGKAMTDIIKKHVFPRIAALEADNKALTDMVSELESKVARLEKRA